MNTLMEDIKYTNRHPFLRVVVQAGEVIGGIITIGLFVLLVWLFLIATPDQRSAECDLYDAQVSEMESR